MYKYSYMAWHWLFIIRLPGVPLGLYIVLTISSFIQTNIITFYIYSHLKTAP